MKTNIRPPNRGITIIGAINHSQLVVASQKAILRVTSGSVARQAAMTENNLKHLILREITKIFSPQGVLNVG